MILTNAQSHIGQYKPAKSKTDRPKQYRNLKRTRMGFVAPEINGTPLEQARSRKKKS